MKGFQECITCGLYIFNPLFEGQKRFFQEFFFRKFCLYVWLSFKSGLQSRAVYDTVPTVYEALSQKFHPDSIFSQ